MSALTTIKNVSTMERAISAGLGGFALARYGGNSIFGTLLAAGLLQRAATGHCAVYQALGVDTHDSTTPTFQRPSVRLTKTVTISASPEKIFPFFTTDLEHLVALSPEILSLERLDGGKSRWTMKTPVGKTTFTSRIISQEVNRRVSWMCEEGHFPHSGEVFLDPGSRGTLLRVTMEYRPLGGAAAAQLSRITGIEPHEALERTLYNLQSLLEAGEVAKASNGSIPAAAAGKEIAL